MIICASSKAGVDYFHVARLRTRSIVFLLFVSHACSCNNLCGSGDRGPPKGVNATAPSGRQLDASVVWDNLNDAGAYQVSEMELKVIEETCLDQKYETVLFQEKAHFFLGALAPESAPSECLSLGFASVLGEKTMLKGKYEHIARFNHDERQGFLRLRDILEAFQKVTPVSRMGFVHEEDTCIHFAMRIWRELGVTETKKLGDFIVANILRAVPDKLLEGFIAAQMGGGIGIVAKFAKRRIIEKAVFSQLRLDYRGRALAEDAFADEMSKFGLKYGFDHRHLEGDCRDLIYNVDLLVIGNALIFVEPASEAAEAGCSAFLLYTSIDAVSMEMEKEVMQFEDGIPPHDELAQYHATMIGMEAKPLRTIVHAFYEASLCPPGYEGEHCPDDLINSNPGDFVANFFTLLGHVSSVGETAVITAGLLMSDPDLAATLRASANETEVEDMTDLELLEWVVQKRTEPMYNTTH